MHTIALPSTLSPRARLAAHAYLSRYSGVTLRTYVISLDLYFRWLLQYGVDPLEARRPQLELYIRVHLQQERGSRGVRATR